MKNDSDREKVRAWLKKTSNNQASLARKIGASGTFISQFLNGDREISDFYISVLATATGIQEETFRRCRAARKLGKEAA